MYEEFVILIADRNRHVRELLRREFMMEGYRVQVARDSREVLMTLEGVSPPDLLILDLEIPYAGGSAILDQLRDRYPSLPVVIHTLLPESASQASSQPMSSFVEKDGNTDYLKAAVLDMLKKYYPARFMAGEKRLQQLKEGCRSLD